jgi:EPS-associated MarR family transcriptional regulator
LHQEEIELKILKSLGKVTSQKNIAEEIGYSAGKVNYVLKKLVEKGLVKVDRFVNSKSKVQYKYLLTSEGIKEKITITEKFIQIKKAEYDKLQEDLKSYKEQYLGEYN